MFAKLQFMTFLYQTIMKMMIILMTQKPPFSKLLRRKNAFKGIFNSWITHAIFASTYGIVVFAQFSRRRWMLETMNTQFTKRKNSWNCHQLVALSESLQCQQQSKAWICTEPANGILRGCVTIGKTFRFL